MSDGRAPAEQASPQPVPPASRLGAVVGWSLPLIAVTCLVASTVTFLNVGAEAGRHGVAAYNSIIAHAGYDAAARAADAATTATYREYAVRMGLLAIAIIVSLLTVPGLLYAASPVLLGGPIGRLLRRSSTRIAQSQFQPLRRHPVSFYQGLGLALMSAGVMLIPLALIATMLFGVMWLMFPTMLLWLAAYFLAFPLVSSGTWWSTGSRETAESVRERPNA